MQKIKSVTTAITMPSDLRDYLKKHPRAKLNFSGWVVEAIEEKLDREAKK